MLPLSYNYSWENAHTEQEVDTDLKDRTGMRFSFTHLPFWFEKYTNSLVFNFGGLLCIWVDWTWVQKSVMNSIH